MNNAATSALRLHQRVPRVQLTRQFLETLLLEDSCHYLFYSLIFLYTAPVACILSKSQASALVTLNSIAICIVSLKSVSQNGL